MTLTHTHFDKGQGFCLANVLELNLHNYVDDVMELVEVATKERKLKNACNLLKMHGLA